MPDSCAAGPCVAAGAGERDTPAHTDHCAPRGQGAWARPGIPTAARVGVPLPRGVAAEWRALWGGDGRGPKHAERPRGSGRQVNGGPAAGAHGVAERARAAARIHQGAGGGGAHRLGVRGRARGGGGRGGVAAGAARERRRAQPCAAARSAARRRARRTGRGAGCGGGGRRCCCGRGGRRLGGGRSR